MKDEEKKELEQEYENLKLLWLDLLAPVLLALTNVSLVTEAYGVPENAKEREALINDILDRMNEIQEKLKKL